MVFKLLKLTFGVWSLGYTNATRTRLEVTMQHLM